MPYVREASVLDAIRLAPRLRQEDKDEIKAASGHSPEAALVEGVFVSDPCWTVFSDEDEPIVMFGVAPSFVEDVGSPWLLAAPEVEKIAIPFLRGGFAYLKQMHERYPLLFNFADARNVVHLKWLRWLGFKFIQRHETFGVEQRPFIEFVRLEHVGD